MENVKSFFSKYKNSTHNENNSEDSSHQALTYFSFSEFLSSDFRHNKFLQFLMENNMATFRHHTTTQGGLGDFSLTAFFEPDEFVSRKCAFLRNLKLKFHDKN
jgi:hypothetical protein